MVMKTSGRNRVLLCLNLCISPVALWKPFLLDRSRGIRCLVVFRRHSVVLLIPFFGLSHNKPRWVAVRFSARVHIITPPCLRRRATGLTRDFAFTFDILACQWTAHTSLSAASLLITLFGGGALQLPFSISWLPPQHTHKSHCSLSLQQLSHFCKWLHLKSTGKAHVVRIHLAGVALLLPLQAQCPGGYEAQSYSLPTWIKYVHCQHFLQQPGTLFIFARHRAE